MVDTCIIKHQDMSSSVYYNVISILKNSGVKLIYPKDQNSCFTTKFGQGGIKKIALKNKMDDNGYHHYSITLELHPVQFTRPDDYISLLRYSDMKSFVGAFNKTIKSIDENLPLFDQWEVVRIDYAVQIYTEFTPVYIDLFQRGDNVRWLCPSYDKTDHRKKQSKGSLYLKAKDFLTVNFYDKYDELNKGHPHYSRNEEAKNLLRFEVQCHKRKVKELMAESKDLSESASALFTPEICRKVITEIYGQLIGNGHYLSLDDAKKIVNLKNPKSKDKLKEVLKLVNSKRSISEARSYFNKINKQSDNRRFNRYLNNLRDLGINPVTIPIIMMKQIPADFLVNPLNDLLKQLDDESSEIQYKERELLYV